MKTRSLVGAATVVTVGCMLGSAAASAAAPTATVTASGYVISAHVHSAGRYALCELTAILTFEGSVTNAYGFPNGAGDVEISLPLHWGEFTASVLCAGGGMPPVRIVDNQPVTLPAE